MFGLGPTEMLIILVIVLLIFGAKRLPEIGKGIGGAIREFKNVKKELSPDGESREEQVKEADKGEQDNPRTLEGRAGAVAFFLGSQKDRGKWWIEGSKLCHRWNTWFNRRTSCVRVYQEADNRISWIDQDGDRGTGTIVALNPVVKAEPAAPAEVRAPEKAEPAQRAVSQPAQPVVVRPAVVAQALPRAVAAPPPR